MDTNEYEKFKSMSDEELSKLPRDLLVWLSNQAAAAGDHDFDERLWQAALREQTEMFFHSTTRQPDWPDYKTALMPRAGEFDDLSYVDIADVLGDKEPDELKSFVLPMQRVRKEDMSPGEKRMLEVLQSRFDDFVTFLNHHRDDVPDFGMGLQQKGGPG